MPDDVDLVGLARTLTAMRDIGEDLRLTVQNPHVTPAVRAAAHAVIAEIDGAVAVGAGIMRLHAPSLLPVLDRAARDG